MSDDPQKLTPPDEVDNPEAEPGEEEEPATEEPEERDDPLKIWITEVTTRLDSLQATVNELHAAHKTPKENTPPETETNPPQPQPRKRKLYRWAWQKD